MDSILTSVKKMLGIDEEYYHFNADIIMHINSAISVLHQLGVGPADGLVVEDESATWNDLTTDTIVLGLVKPYIYAKVKLLFDPPTSSAVMESTKEIIRESEWRLNVQADHTEN